MSSSTRKPKDDHAQDGLAVVSMEAVNERLYRLENEVDAIQADLSEQKVAMARVTEQVAAHEKRGEERHVQLIGAIQDIRSDYKALMKQQSDDSRVLLSTFAESVREKSANQTKIILAIITLLTTIAAAMYGFNPFGAVTTPAAPAAPTHKSP